MGIGRQLRQFATRRATRKLTRAVPWLGAVIALMTLGATMRRKGFLGGALDTALDFTPVVGTMKNVAEVGRGRDFIRDKLRTATREADYRDRGEPSRFAGNDLHLCERRKFMRPQHTLDTTPLSCAVRSAAMITNSNELANGDRLIIGYRLL